MTGSERQGLTRARRRALDRLLAEYLEKPDDGREGFLKQCHQRWPRLSRWLDELVAAERGVTLTLMDRPLKGVARQALEWMDQHEENQLGADHRLGPWRIGRPAGGGGLGKVYRGERADGAFDMAVAIKLLRMRGAGLGEQLQRESRLLARLEHPAIARLLDAGLDDQAGPFLVMEWIDGQDLSEWVQDQPSRERCLEVMMALCEAVDHAHRKLIVHGDIKPGNVRIDHEGRVKLLDFGIARLLGATEEHSNTIAALTPTFAPPEQHRGEPLDARSDVWALGALLAWMLRGGVDGVIHDTELQAVIDKACADDPEQRYASASAMLTDLQRYREHRPLAAVPASVGYRARKFVRRNPVLVGGVAATVAAMIVGLSTTSLWYLQADQQARTLEQVVGFQERQLAGMEPALMGSVLRESLTEESRDKLAILDDAGVSTSAQANELEAILTAMNFSDIAVEALDESVFSTSLVAIDEEFQDQPTIRARLIQSVATALRELGRFDSAAKQQERALRLRSEHLGADHPDTLHSVQERALLSQRQGQLEAAEEDLRLALDGRREALGPLHPDSLQTKHEIAYLMMSTERPDMALDYGYHVLEARREVLGNEHPDTLRTVKLIGMTYRWMGRFEEAIQPLQESYQGVRRYFGDRHPNTLRALAALAHVLGRKGRLEESRAKYARILESSREVLGDRHPSTVHTVCSKGIVLQQMELIDQAEPLYLECVKGREQIFGSAHPETLSAYNSMGVLLRLRQAYEESVEFLEKALAGQLRMYGNQHRAPLITKHNLGRTLEEKGRLERALKVQSRVVAGFEKMLTDDHWLLGAGLNGKGRILHRMGRYEDAESVFMRVWEIYAGALGPEHHRTAKLITYMDDFYSDWAVELPDDQLKLAKQRWQAKLSSLGTEEVR